MKINKILIFAEVNNAKINSVYYELLSKAKDLVSGPDAKIGCVIVGSKINPLVEEVSASGVDEVFYLDDERVNLFNIDFYSAALLRAVENFYPEVILVGATSIGEELAPTMGIKLKTGVAAHCLDVSINKNGELVQVVPAFGGKVVGEIYTPNTNPKIVSIKPGILTLKEHEKYQAKKVNLDNSILDITKSKIQAIEIALDISEEMDINKSDFVICAGYGISSCEITEDLKTISKGLNGSIGYTRPAIDSGMDANENNMIGTSGKSVKPKIYLGVGVSGSTHHICGIKDSEIIIGVNKDPKSELFNICDYKAVADGEKVIKELAELIKNQK